MELFAQIVKFSTENIVVETPLIFPFDVFSINPSGNSGVTCQVTPSAISKTSQSVWVLTLNGTNLGSNAAGTETLSVDAASNTAIYDLAGNAHTAAATTTTLNDTATLSDSVSSTVGSGGGTVSAGNTNASPRAS